MRETKQRPLLHASDRQLRKRLIWLAATFALIALSLIFAEANGKLITRIVGEENYKTLLQFFLVAAGGGVLVAIVTNLRDEAARRQARAASIQALQRELDSAFRALKKIKRRLRAHRVHSGAPDRIKQAAFEQSMDELLEAQLELETICEHIWQRNDILRPDRLKRMREPLRYAARYYHDVHEDFERGRVYLEDGHYVLVNAPNLLDYLRSQRDPPPARPGSVDAALSRLEENSRPLDDRAKALVELIEASPAQCSTKSSDGNKLRYADVAHACAELILFELTQVRTNLLT